MFQTQVESLLYAHYRSLIFVLELMRANYKNGLREKQQITRKGKTLGSIAAKKSRSRSSKAGLQFSFGCIAWFLKANKYAKGVGAKAPVFLAVVLEYLAAKVNFAATFFI